MRNAEAATEMLPLVVLDTKAPLRFAFMASSSESP
jgi:hypothetical protein